MVIDIKNDPGCQYENLINLKKQWIKEASFH